MRLFDIQGRSVSKNVSKYLVDWSKPCRSKIQTKVKNFFEDYWCNHICYEEFPVFGSRMKVDLVNMTKKIAVEVQGEQHDSFNKFFHNNSRSNYLKSIIRDQEKYKWLEMNNFKILEIKKEDLPHLNRSYICKTFGIDI